MVLKVLKFKRLPFSLSLFCLLFFFNPLHAEDNTLQTGEVSVLFEKSLENVAKDVVNIYPAVKAELIQKIGLEVDFRPEVLLVRGRDFLNKRAGNDIIVAFAIPERNSIVLDISKVYAKPFSLEATLKHELCHLLLRRHIKGERLPRWLDEGICQWSSGGIAEIMTDSGDNILARATISDRLIPINELRRFPTEKQSLILAYEESKSIVEYIVAEFGEHEILQVLEYLKKGYSLDEALWKSLSVTTSELELKWHAYLKKKYTRISYLSRNLYIILFSLAALLTVYGFIRMLKKKKVYMDEAEKDDSGT